MKIADVFQVSDGWRAVGRIDIASLCGLTTGPWYTPPKYPILEKLSDNRESLVYERAGPDY